MNGIAYHYTDSQGLCGIVNSASLWLTHADFLNDVQEAKIGRSLGLGLIEEVARGQVADTPDLVKVIASVAIERIKLYDADTMGPDSQFHNGIFIASLSDSDNDLSQYRAYSAPNARYCIGFRTDELKRLATASSLDFSEVVYESGDFKSGLYKQFLASAIAMVELHNQRQYHPNDPTLWHYPDIPDMVQALLMKNTPLAKHGAFHAEKEFRLHTLPRTLGTYISTDRLLFRSGAQGLTPYISQSLSDADQLIASITVGPCQYPTSALDAVKLLVRRRHSLENRDRNMRKLFVENLMLADSGIPFLG